MLSAAHSPVQKVEFFNHGIQSKIRYFKKLYNTFTFIYGHNFIAY